MASPSLSAQFMAFILESARVIIFTFTCVTQWRFMPAKNFAERKVFWFSAFVLHKDSENKVSFSIFYINRTNPII